MLGVWLLIEAFTRRLARTHARRSGRARRTRVSSPRAFLWVTGGLFAQMALIQHAGFVLAAACCSPASRAASAAGGSCATWRSAWCSVSLVFLFFVKLLNVSLPAGWLSPMLGSGGHMSRRRLRPHLLSGFSVALTPINLLWGFVGVTLGTAVGVLPGVGPALTVAMLLPLTVKLDPTGALIMFAGIYYGAMYGGSTTTILLNTPGESASIATALEGNKMAKRGRAGPALATAAIGSFVAGTIATVLLTLLAPIVVEIALQFGPAEYFALMVFAFVTVAAVLGSSTVRGLTTLFIGLLLGLVGIDEPDRAGALRVRRAGAARRHRRRGGRGRPVRGRRGAVRRGLPEPAVTEEIEKLSGSLWMTRDDWRRSWPAWLRATAIGFPFGTIPAGGAEIPTFLSYALEKKLTKHPEEFGNGAIEGRGRARRRPTTRPRPACWCRC